MDESLLSDFIAETQELLQEMEASVLLLEEDHQNRDVVDDIFRSIHTIKGSSEYLGMAEIAELAHKLENLLDLVRQNKHSVDSRLTQLLMDTEDRISLLIEAVNAQNSDPIEIDDLIVKIDTIASGDLPAEVPMPDGTEAVAPDMQGCNSQTDEQDLLAEIAEDDEEIVAIFLEQFKDGYDAFRAAIISLVTSVSKDESFSESVAALESLRSSSNYMGYDQLCGFYEEWIELVTASKAMIVGDGSADPVSFFKTCIDPMVAKLSRWLPYSRVGFSLYIQMPAFADDEFGEGESDNCDDGLISSDLFSDMAMEIMPLEETGSHDLNSPDGSFENMALDEELSLDETLTLADVPDELLTDAFDLASEEIDETSLIEEFVVEAREHLQQSDAALLAILEGDDSKGLVDDTFRSIHTIKGSAEYLGLEKASQLLHKMESLLDLIRQGDRKADRHTVVSLLNAKDTVQQLVEASMDEQALHGIDITAALERLDAVEPPADEIESQTDNSSADDALEGGRQWRLEIEDDSVAELMDDFHEDYDEELFSIFLEQFETHIDSIDQALADYSADQSIDHVLSLVLESIRHLKNSANYMGYDRLCSLYDQQSDNIHAFLSSDVLLEGTAGLEFFESAIQPWALKIRSLLHPEVLLRPSEADAAPIDEVTAQTYDLESFKENADGPDGSVDPDEPDDVEDPGMPYMDSTETAHSIKMKLSAAVDLSPEEQDLFRLLESAFNSSMPGAAESVPVHDQGVLGSELFSSDLPQEINGDEDVTEKVYDDTDHSSVTEESGLLNDILSAIADGTSFDSPLKTLSDLLPTDVESDFAVEDPEDVPAVEEAALQTIEDIFSSQPLPIVDLIPDKPVETPAVVERTAKHNIRVDAAKIDLLMNQVGELVVNRSVFTQLANDLRLLQQYFKQDLDLNKKELKPMQELALRLGDATVSLGRVANDLQEGVMKVRMLPISQLFNRYPRLVHDLTRKSGKKVHLDIKGADTELDRMVIEEISDPLVHIIRNAVDHGIETTQERIDAGKTESGTISLTAYHESNNVVIEISDDGKGLDIEKIRNRGIENGLIPEGAVGLPMGTLVDLIAQPGFSTADTITHTSGRGVGMDVVKKNIEKLNGNLEIDSRPGKGTKIRIKIPLTLAIFSALLVRVEDELYTVPLASVEETLRIQEEEINVVEGVEVIHLRDEPVPLLPLPKLFNKRETLTNESGKMYAVIVNNGKMRVGLIVDSLLGQEEVVIKPLEDYLQENSGFSGATILGDGQISLILDVYELVKITMDRKDKIAAETLI